MSIKIKRKKYYNSPETLNERRKEMKNPHIVRILEGTVIQNKPKTADDKSPVKGIWIEYWKKYSGVPIPKTCPLCGENFTPDDDADGCHIRKVNSEGDPYGKTYIIPGHHDCNCQREKTFKLKHSVVAVETK